MRSSIFLAMQIVVFLSPSYGHQDKYAEVRFAIQGGKGITLPCPGLSYDSYLLWKFSKNGTRFAINAAQVFPGNIKNVFSPFNSPPGRSELREGNFVIHKVEVQDEGFYWCEITKVASPTKVNQKYPVHVYVAPSKLYITSLNNNTLTEKEKVKVARCSSQGGKPGATLVWMNGSTAMSSRSDIVYRENEVSSALTDSFVDLQIINLTRYDHKRSFSCVIEHPAYEGKQKILNYTFLVKHHPVNARIRVNLTSRYISCEAEGYPEASYTWKLPGEATEVKGTSLFIPDLYDMPGHDYFECTASNGIIPDATVRIKVADILYSDGNQSLHWRTLGIIIGGVGAVVMIIISYSVQVTSA